MKTFAMTSLGCKVNSYESNAIINQFINDGYQQVPYDDKVDVYIINTCTVTNTGDAKSRKLIRQAQKRNPQSIICVFGCYAQTNPDEIMKIEGVDIIVGTQHRDQILGLVKQHQDKQVIKVEQYTKDTVFEELAENSYTKNQRAYLKIQEGCDNYCSYCIIPYARGPVRSRSKENIIKEAHAFVDKGFKEIVLTGIHTGGYGKELSDYSFDELLEDLIEELKGKARLRISSIEISELTDKTLDLIKNSGVLVNHLHIPLQAGSDEILTKMKRKYLIEDYLNKVNSIRAILPNIALTTDLIVGFPGESDKLFNQTLETLKQCQFSDIHVFPYSPRKGTPAADMDQQVNDQIKKERVNQVIALTKQLNKQYYDSNVNQTKEIIIEGHHDGMSYGLSDNYLKIYIDEVIPKGELVKVKVLPNNKGEVVK